MTRIHFLKRGILAGASICLAAWGSCEDMVSFHDDIFPILEARCFKCHSDEKQKGDLRLDSPAWIERGSESGKVLTAGNAEDSPLYYLTTYDPDDPDYMPSKGKGLTDTEKQLLKRWIDQGANFGEAAGGMMAEEPSVPPSSAVGAKYADDVPLPPATYELPRKFEPQVGLMKEAGLLVDTVNHDANYLEVTYSYAATGDAFAVSLIEPVADAVVRLNFARSSLSDDQLSGFAVCQRVEHLDLRNTEISDVAMKTVGKLKRLESLNLYGTGISDAGLAELYGLTGLRRIYLRGSLVTEQGVARLQKAIPGLRVVL